MMKKLNRREFIKLSGVTIAAAVLGFKAAVTEPTKATVKHEEKEVWLLEDWGTLPVATYTPFVIEADPVWVDIGDHIDAWKSNEVWQLYQQSIFKDHASVVTYDDVVKSLDILH